MSMDRSKKILLFLAGLGVGGAVGTYLLLRRHRDKVEEAADRTRRLADQADRLARTLEGLEGALGPKRREEGSPADD